MGVNPSKLPREEKTIFDKVEYVVSVFTLVVLTLICPVALVILLFRL